MKKLTTLTSLLLASVLLVACGGEDDAQGDEIVCGEGTVLHGERCVPVGDCPAGQFALDDGRCVRTDYCGPGTSFSEATGRCSAETSLTCGENTEEVDQECVPAVLLECGVGTVVSNGACLPSEEVCGDGTVQSPQADCRPASEICGTGTVFDVDQRRCVRTSTLVCGAGTYADNNICLPTSAFYDTLAESPDLDLTETEVADSFTLAEPGERFVFVGNIDRPTSDGSGLTQDEDRLNFDAQAGQWLRIGVYSLGLPEPGFEVTEGDGGSYWRMSDIGSGIEATRQLLIPRDGTYQLRVGNLPQMIDLVSPAGGDDWNYIAYVEVIEAPQPQTRSFGDEIISGDIRDFAQNYYRFSGATAGERFALFLNTLPNFANLEILLWGQESDDLLYYKPSEDIAILTAVDEEFDIFFDYDHATGTFNNFSARITTEGISSTTVSVEAGEYLRISQDNPEDLALNLSVDDSGSVLFEGSLAALGAETGGRYIHLPFDEDASVTVTAYTTDGQPLDDYNISLETFTADSVTGIDGSLVEFSSLVTLLTEQRHYIHLEVDYDDLILLQLTAATGEAHLHLFDSNRELIGGGAADVVFPAQPGNYWLEVEAISDLTDGFELTAEETNIFDISVSSSPSLAIPDNNNAGVTDVINIASCPVVQEISMDIDITHSWRGDLVVYLKNPAGEERALFARHGSSADDLVGNFNETLDALTSTLANVTAELINTFEGSSGTGSWTIRVADEASGISGTLNSWQLIMTCT